MWVAWEMNAHTMLQPTERSQMYIHMMYSQRNEVIDVDILIIGM